MMGLLLAGTVGCANVLGLDDKQVVSETEYQNYLATGELPDGEGADSSFGEGGDSGTEDAAFDDGTSSDGSTFEQPEANFDLEPAGLVDFSYGFLEADTLRGFVFSDAFGAEVSSSDFSDQPDPPYCVTGVLPGQGEPAIVTVAVTLNEWTPGSAEPWLPTRDGILADYSAAGVVDVWMQISGDAGSWCSGVSAEGPDGVVWQDFREKCRYDSHTAYDPTTEIESVALMVTNPSFEPVEFQLCLFGVVEL